MQEEDATFQRYKVVITAPAKESIEAIGAGNLVAIEALITAMEFEIGSRWKDLPEVPFSDGRLWVWKGLPLRGLPATIGVFRICEDKGLAEVVLVHAVSE